MSPEEMEQQAKDWIPDQMVDAAIQAYAQAQAPRAVDLNREAMRQALLAGHMWAQRFTVWSGFGLEPEVAADKALRDLKDPR